MTLSLRTRLARIDGEGGDAISSLRMDDLEALANKLTDMDWGWWPFLHLRPPRDQPISTRHVAKMALHFGPPVGVFVAIVRRSLRAPGGSSLLVDAVVWVLYLTVSFFVGYRLTFAWCWNRRAARLASQNADEGRSRTG